MRRHVFLLMLLSVFVRMLFWLRMIVLLLCCCL